MEPNVRYYMPYSTWCRNKYTDPDYRRIDAFDPNHLVGVYWAMKGTSRGIDERFWYCTYSSDKDFETCKEAMTFLDRTLRKLGHYLIEPEEVERFKKLALLV